MNFYNIRRCEVKTLGFLAIIWHPDNFRYDILNYVGKEGFKLAGGTSVYLFLTKIRFPSNPQRFPGSIDVARAENVL